MLELHVANTLTGSATMPVRWMVEKATFDKLREREIKDPLVLIIIRDPSGKEVRSLHPLKDAMCYVSFRRPGTQTILATIVWDKDKTTAHDLYMRTSCDRYTTDVLKRFEVVFCDGWADHLGSARAEVLVDKELFAKEPHPALAWWVNLWYREKPVDQCEFRHRGMWAFTAKIPAMIVFLAFKYFAMIASGTIMLLLAVDPRRIGWRVLLHPFNIKFDHYLEECDADAFPLHMQWRKDIETSAWFPFAFSPLFLLVTAGVTALAFEAPWDTGVYHTATVLNVFKVALAMALFSLLLVAYETRTKSYRERRRLERLQLEAMPWFARPGADIGYLLAQRGTTVSFDLRSLPKPVRTVGLWFDGIKAQVCRPFAQG